MAKKIPFIKKESVAYYIPGQNGEMFCVSKQAVARLRRKMKKFPQIGEDYSLPMRKVKPNGAD